jgi:RNA polymerase sigma factor (sigma-70 family)
MPPWSVGPGTLSPRERGHRPASGSSPGREATGPARLIPTRRRMSAPAPDPRDPAGMFLANLVVIDRVISIICRRHALAAGEAEEFRSWARERLIDDDYAVLRKFQGRSALSTYLVSVLTHLFADFRNARWGRWRPSAAARRLGPTAIRLEQLVYRDGLPPRQAVEFLRSAGDATGPELARILSVVPPRWLAREVSLDAAGGAAATDQADDGLWATERASELARTRAALDEALAGESEEDRVVVHLCFWDGMSVADVARALHLDQKPLYRRLDAIKARLRDRLGRAGIDSATVLDLLSGLRPE